MLRSLLFLLFLYAVPGWGQSIAGLNFRHLYDPTNEVNMALKLVHEKDQLAVYFKFQRTNQGISDRYSIEWSHFESYTEKGGTPVPVADSTATEGKFTFPSPEKPWILSAKITNQTTSKSWRYLQIIDSKYPVNGYLTGGDGIIFKPYISAGQEVTVHTSDDKPVKVYYYKTDFSVANPPFTDKGMRIDRFMFHDSTFTLSPGQKISFRSTGLYLAQQDTMQARGFAFVVEGKSYPKSTRIEEIPDPLVFVSTKVEHDELLAAGSDKTKIDKVILDITRDKEKAKNFMRSYFRRVELANTYFTSFKEGWKTDRGMIFLIFGIPDEVGRTGPNEVWYYKNLKERFTFVKTGSVYDPDSFVLQRNAKYTELWFGTVDLWRKSRF